MRIKINQNAPPMKQRFQQLMSALDLTQDALAKSMKCSPQYLSRYFNSDRASLKMARLVNFANAFPKVNINWIVRGEGQMFLTEKSEREKGMEKEIMELKLKKKL